MFTCYLIFIISSVMTAANNAWLMKKYQLIAGTGIYANILFMLVNGVVSAVIPACVLAVQKETFEVTGYSIIIAMVTVLCAAVSMIGIMKAYEVTSVAIVNLFQILGNVLISCFWGVLFLEERLSVRQIAAIALILAAVLLITAKKQACFNQRALGLCLIVFVSAGFINVLTKVHQIETRFETVNTLSFSIWIGMIRVIVFSILFLSIGHSMIEMRSLGNKALGYAVLTSVVSGTCYIATLIVAVFLPITVTSPLNTGIAIGLTTFIPWILYRENLSKRELAGIALSLLGILLYMSCYHD